MNREMMAVFSKLALAVVLAVFLSLTGCGSDGSDGVAGVNGLPGTDGTDGDDAQTLVVDTCIYCHGEGSIYDSATVHEVSTGTVAVTTLGAAGVTIADDAGGLDTFSINFNIDLDATNAGEIAEFTEPYSRDPTELNNLRFSLLKFVPATATIPSTWDTLVKDERLISGMTATDLGDGLYNIVYDFAFDPALSETSTNIAALRPDLYGTAGQYRIVAYVRNIGDMEPLNEIADIDVDSVGVPADGLHKEVVSDDACNECHAPLQIHGNKRAVGYCVVCHNGNADAFDYPLEIDLINLVHKLHSGVDTIDPSDDSVIMEGIGYPQSMTNCTKCHKDVVNADNWMLPTYDACSTCHFELFTDSTVADYDHTGMGSGSSCGCHGGSVALSHRSDMATPHNPDLPAGYSVLEYELTSATVDGDTNELTVVFNLLVNGNAFDLSTIDGDGNYDVNGTLLLSTDTAPDFLFSYAMGQDGVTNPADYNNLGQSAAQPERGDIADLTEAGSIIWDGDGSTNIAIIADGFPVGATMRSVSLQGYIYTMKVNPDYIDPTTTPDEDPFIHDLRLKAKSVVIEVTGDDLRRMVVDSAKCANCHEWFEGHGSNRIYEVQVCLTCHNPNLSSSGRTLDLAHPEDTNNFKELIHGIHASGMRESAYVFVRIRGGNAYFYDWSHVEFPGNLLDCETCHLAGTYSADMTVNVLATTVVTTNGAIDEPADVDAARDTLPNSNDLVNTPVSSTCYYCHDTIRAQAHYISMGGGLSVERNRLNLTDTSSTPSH